MTKSERIAWIVLLALLVALVLVWTVGALADTGCVPDERVTPMVATGVAGGVQLAECAWSESRTDEILILRGARDVSGNGDWWQLDGVRLEALVGGAWWVADVPCHTLSYCSPRDDPEPVCYDVFACDGVGDDRGVAVQRYVPCPYGTEITVRASLRWTRARDGEQRLSGPSCPLPVCCPLLWMWGEGARASEYVTNEVAGS